MMFNMLLGLAMVTILLIAFTVSFIKTGRAWDLGLVLLCIFIITLSYLNVKYNIFEYK